MTYRAPYITSMQRQGRAAIRPIATDWSKRATRLPNKGMKQTKPAQAMELRSLSPVFARPC